MQTYSTRCVPESRRLAYWSALASSTIAPMSIEAGSDRFPFQGRLTTLRLGPIGVSSAYSTAVVIHRRGRPVPLNGQKDFIVTMGADADFAMETSHWQRYVRRNDLLITDSTQPGVVRHAGCTAITLRVPQRLFGRYLPDIDALPGVVVRGDEGPGAFAASLIRSILPGSAPLVHDSAAEHIALAVLHSIAAAYAHCSDIRFVSDNSAGARRQAVLEFVEANLGTAELSVKSIAEHFELSDRYVRLLFASGGESLSAYILRRRLEESARELRDPVWSRSTVSDIAFRWGFNSLGSYDRAFRTRYDVTPRQYRQRARA